MTIRIPEDSGRVERRTNPLSLSSGRLPMALFLALMVALPPEVYAWPKWCRFSALAGRDARPVSETPEPAKTEGPTIPEAWFHNEKPDRVVSLDLPHGVELDTATIPMAFLNHAGKAPKKILLIDAVRTFTNQDALAATELLGPEIRRRFSDNEYVPFMLPPSAGAAVTVLAAQRYGKVPVGVNWTTGKGPFLQSLDNIGAGKILTSRLVYRELSKKFEYLKDPEVRDRLVFLEDFQRADSPLGKKLFAAKKIWAGVKSRYLPWWGMRLAARKEPAAQPVVLDYYQPHIETAVPENVVAVMMPHSAEGRAVELAAQRAEKATVHLDPSQSAAEIREWLEATDAKRILTTRRMFEEARKHDPSLAELEDRMVFVDEFGQGNWLDGVKKAAAWTRGTLAGGRVRDTSIVLFTSGSSGTPKAVPLRHQNQLANVDGLSRVEPLTEVDRVVSMLPGFHSFGATGTIALPLAAGVPTAYTPNPIAGKDVAQAVKNYGGTVIMGTPDFLKFMARGAKENELGTLRLGIYGAQAMNPATRDAIESKLNEHAVVMGAYGQTEAGPAITSNRAATNEHGTIGYELPGVQTVIVEPTAEGGYREVAPGEQGRLLVRGPNIFPGYLHHKGKQPFVTHGERRWLDTGDMARRLPSGNLVLEGRANMDFIKKGGEMIGFNQIARVLDKKFNNTDGEIFAILGDERDSSSPRIVLFTTRRDLNRETLNQAVTEGGLTNLYKIDEVVHLDEFPLLGPGKMDKKKLHNIANGKEPPPGATEVAPAP